MTKILFIQDIEYEFQGIIYISSILKYNNHECKLLFPQKDLIKNVMDYNPNLIFFYTMTGSHRKLIDIARAIKKELTCKQLSAAAQHQRCLCLTVFGGPHATFFPEMINEEGVDIICRGEGEYACLELADIVGNEKPFINIKNLWVKKDGKIYKNELRPLIENLDELPQPDRSIYYEASEFLKNNPTKNFMTGRGCPYQCTFCLNKSYNDMYKGKGPIIRKHSKEYVIEHIKDTIKKYPIKFLNIVDDTFNINKKWLLDFLELYKQEINFPFVAQIRLNLLDGEIIKKLKEANCHMAMVGLESGNDYMRNKVLKKELSREKIIEICALLKKHKIKFETFNVLGLPNETIAQAFETINLNAEIGADYTAVYLFQPYPKTELEAYSRSLGLLGNHVMNEIPLLAFDTSILKNKYKKELINLEKFFNIAVKYPSLHLLIKKLIKLPNNFIYNFMFDICNLYRHKQVFGHSWVNVLKLAYRIRKSY